MYRRNYSRYSKNNTFNKDCKLQQKLLENFCRNFSKNMFNRNCLQKSTEVSKKFHCNNNKKHQKQVEFDRPGKRSPEYDGCCWQWLTLDKLCGSHLQSQSELYHTRPSTDVIQLTLTLTMTTVQVVQTSVTGEFKIEERGLRQEHRVGCCYWSLKFINSQIHGSSKTELCIYVTKIKL